MQKYNDAMKTSRHRSLEKYTSHLFEKVWVWEGVGDRTELRHIDPHSYGHNSVSFSFSWTAQQWPDGPASLGHGPHSYIFSLTATAQSNWELVLSSASYLLLVWTPTDLNFLSPGLYNNLTSTLLPASVTISHSIQTLEVKVISWYSSTGCTCYLHRWISYLDSDRGEIVDHKSKRSNFSGVVVNVLDLDRIISYAEF